MSTDLLVLSIFPFAMALAAAGGAIWLAHRQQSTTVDGELPLRNPMELLPALGFGLLLAAIMLLAEAFRAWLGDTGIYVLATISGIADVDAITLSLARMARDSAYGVFEVGMNHAGEISALTAVLRPQVAIITTIEPVHLEFFTSVEGIADAKAEILAVCVRSVGRH